MSSTTFSLPKGTWVQITTTDNAGSVRQQSGNTVVIYTEAETIPAATNPNTPVMESTRLGESFAYFRVAATDNIWANANNEDAVVVVSPRGV
jgi:hypothetical protein